MAGTQNISGIVSGLDTNNIIKQLIEHERIPQNNLKAEKKQIQNKINNWSALEAKLLGFKTSVSSLKKDSTWDNFSASTSDETIMSVDTTSSSMPGDYCFSVNQLAQNQQKITFEKTELTDSIEHGTLKVDFGDSQKTFNIDATNNTLEGVKKSINDADIDVTASIVNTGDKYSLVLMGENTGSDGSFNVTWDPESGTEQGFDTISLSDTSNWTGSSLNTDGIYTAHDDETYTFTASADGTVGSGDLKLNWTDTDGNSGSVDIGDGYTAGELVEVADGVNISVDSGSVTNGDSFDVEVQSTTIQEPQDAKLNYGTGENAIEITSSTNEVEDVIEGTTLNLKSADAGETVQVSIAQDNSSIQEKVQSMVKKYNSAVKFLNDQQEYDQETKKTGVLFGSTTLMNIDSNLKRKLTSSLPAIRGDLKALSQVGITLNDDTTLNFDTTKFNEELEANYDDLKQLFVETGESSDTNVEFLSATEKTDVTSEGYDVDITKAAQRATISGDNITINDSNPIVIDDQSKYLRINVDGIETQSVAIEEGTYTDGATLAQAVQDALNGDETLGGKLLGVSWEDDDSDETGYFKINSSIYGSDSSLNVQDANGNETFGFSTGDSDTGVDVEGTINGEEAEGTGRLLKGIEEGGAAEGLYLKVSITSDDLSSQGSSQGKFYYSKGVSNVLDNLLDNVTDKSDGVIANKKEALNNKIDNIQDQIDDWDERLERKRESLEREYAQLESTLAELQSQSQYLTSQLSSLSSGGGGGSAASSAISSLGG